MGFRELFSKNSYFETGQAKIDLTRKNLVKGLPFNLIPKNQSHRVFLREFE